MTASSETPWYSEGSRHEKEDPLAKLRAASQDWSGEYLAEQYALGPTAYSTAAAWNIVRTEYQHRGLEVSELNAWARPGEYHGASETPQDHSPYAMHRLLENAPFATVISELVERGLVAGEAQQLVRDLASEIPHDHRSYAMHRLLENTSYTTVTSELIERSLLAAEAQQLVRELAVLRRDQARQSAGLGVLWCMGGLTITAITYYSAVPGETFVVAWGATLFGAIQALRGWSIALRPLPAPDEKTQDTTPSRFPASEDQPHDQ